MAKKIKIGDQVRITKAGIANKRKQYPGFKPSATTGIVTGPGFNNKEMLIAISDGEAFSFPMTDLAIVKSASKGYKHPNAPTLERVEAFTEFLHGSGINYDWEIEETKTSFRASNAYDTMTEGGMYDSVVDFTVIFPKKASMEDFTLQFGADSQYQAQKYMLREYLEDTIAESIR